MITIDVLKSQNPLDFKFPRRNCHCLVMFQTKTASFAIDPLVPPRELLGHQTEGIGIRNQHGRCRTKKWAKKWYVIEQAMLCQHLQQKC